MIDDYLSNRWVIYEGDKWSLKEEMTYGAPQRSRVGPLVWNVMYYDFLRMDLPVGTSIIGFADDALVVCAADDVKILELRINDSLWRAKRWLDSRCLKMAPEKTEALLVKDRRSFKYPKIVLGVHEIEWKKSTKFLGVQLDRRLSFGEHLQIATAKAIQCRAALSRLMPNIGGPREAKRKLVASVVNAEHTLFVCARWGAEREADGRAVGAQLTPDTMVSLMLQSEQIWMLIESFVTLVMKTRELDGGAERGNNGGQ